MLGCRSDQSSLFVADQQSLGFVGADSFYASLARHGRELFPDEECAAIYCEADGGGESGGCGGQDSPMAGHGRARKPQPARRAGRVLVVS